MRRSCAEEDLQRPGSLRERSWAAAERQKTFYLHFILHKHFIT